MAKGGKSGSAAGRSPKKLRGDAARANRNAAIAREAAKVALNTEAHRRMLLRVIATLVEKLGGEVRLPFRLIAGAPDLGMAVEKQGTPDAVMVFAVGDRKAPGIIVGDRVVVHSWSSVLDQNVPDQTDLSWPGRVAAIDEGELLVVELDALDGRDFDRVVVPKAWVTPETSAEVAEIDAAVESIRESSTRVDEVASKRVGETLEHVVTSASKECGHCGGALTEPEGKPGWLGCLSCDWSAPVQG